MKRSIVLIGLLALCQTALAQSTNIQFTIKITDATSTNSVTLNAPPDYVRGFALSYASNVKANGVNAPTFANFVRQEVVDRLKSLQDQSVADTLANNKVATVAAALPTLWPTMTVADQNALATLLQKYAP